MKRKFLRRGVGLLAAVTLASAPLVVAPPAAMAAESVPTLQWPAVDVAYPEGALVSAPDGSITMPCSNSSSGGDLTTYSASGQVVRQIDRSVSIDGVKNCITNPVVDKNGDVYGIPYGVMSSGSSAWGPNILAYDGNTLKWKYPARCGSNYTPVVVGGDGNIYATTHMTDGVHLIGLAPELEPGQTQPAKVLDVKIPDDCSIELFPYRDGLMLRGQNSGFRYYSYGGKLLTQPSVNGFWDVKLNDRGRLFDTKYVSGSYTSASVSMYDPLADQVMWETSASTPGANVQSISVYPVANGSVVALIREQEMNSGVPVTPTKYIYTLVVLNASGQKLHSVPLLNSTQSPDPERVFGTLRAIATSDGKLAMVRDMQMPTSVTYPDTISGLQLSVFDPDTGTLTYGQEMHGDMSKPGGPYGYFLDYPGLVTANNTLAFVGKCNYNCNGARKLYAVQISGLGMDYPRGLVITAETPPQPAPINAVALGDSYTSGQAAGRYDEGTATSTNKCYKSAGAYARVLSRDPYSPWSLTSFAACGGSVTENIDQTGTYPGVAAQSTALTSNTQLVTITIGGNDIGFGDTVKGCLIPLNCGAAIQTARGKLANLQVKLERVFGDIFNRTSSQNGGANALIYVLGYAPLLSNDAPECVIGDAPFGGESRTQAIALLDDLNTTIKTAAVNVGGVNGRIVYVDPREVTSPFIGHSLCTSEPFFNGITLPDIDSFHPKRSGQEAYAGLLANHLN